MRQACAGLVCQLETICKRVKKRRVANCGTPPNKGGELIVGQRFPLDRPYLQLSSCGWETAHVENSAPANFA